MRLLLPLLLLLLAGPVPAQVLPAIGTPLTLDVATWNVEHFGNPAQAPPNDDLQRQNAVAVIGQAEIDLWSVQEMDYQSAFEELVAELGAPYAGVRVEDETSFPIGYGFIYNTEVIRPLETTKVLTAFSADFGFRPPLLLRADVVLPDTTVRNVRFLNVHAKAGGSAADYDRRVAASAALKNYVDNLLALDTPVLVLGDFNDELRSSIYQGEPSPYQNFRADADGYLFATYALDLANLATWCSNASCTAGSTLDHILVTRPLLDDYVAGSMNRYDAVLTAIPNYVDTMSDHLPVFARFDFQPSPTATEGAGTPDAFALHPPFPNPFRDETVLTFALPAASDVRLEVFDALGRRVAVLTEGARPAGTHSVRFEAGSLAPGLYVARLTAGTQTATRRLLHAE